MSPAMSNKNIANAFAALTKLLLDNTLPPIHGQSSIQMILIEHLLNSGVINRDAFLADIENGLAAFNGKYTDMAIPLLEIAHMLAPEKYEKPDHPKPIQFPNWMELIKNAPPLSE
jgi:hypothetical protein